MPFGPDDCELRSHFTSTRRQRPWMSAAESPYSRVGAS
jgi:hypothetical protein